MTDKKAEPIDYILKSELSGVLSKAFAELYRTKPNFPVTYLANWLKTYSSSQEVERKEATKLKESIESYNELQNRNRVSEENRKEEEKLSKIRLNDEQSEYDDMLNKTVYLEDLLINWLPEFIEKKYKFSGTYVGSLTYPYKKIEPTNFSPDAHFDTEAEKIIEYVGASNSHTKIMLMKVLPSKQGISFDCFEEPEPQEEEEQEPAEGEEAAPPKAARKTYINVPDVTKNERIHYFKFPKLGSYACFPIKIQSVLTEKAFDEGLKAYKEYVREKEETEKDYQEKISEARNESEEARKRWEDLELPEEDPTPEQVEEKRVLTEEVEKAEKNLEELEKNPPVIPEPKFETIEKSFVLGCDTLGQDRKISEESLDEIEKKLVEFKNLLEKKERKMLLDDILAYIEEEQKLDSIEVLYREHEKSSNIFSEEQGKEKGLKDKELEFDIAATKAKKVNSIFEDPMVDKSLKTYLNYNVPKFKEILQIGLMLLGYKSSEINEHRTNTLNFRKFKTNEFQESLLQKLDEFDLRPNEASECSEEYKISNLEKRLEEIVKNAEVGEYNGFLNIFANQIKSYCEALSLNRDAKREAYEHSVKAKEERDLEIEKYNEEKDKALEAAKGELDEENLESFNEEEWVSNYISENPGPQPLEVIKLQEYLNID